jgi:MOSC domain-containing protein YiiM
VTGRVVSLQVVPGNHAEPTFVEQATPIPGGGLEGDWHRKRGGRALLLMDAGDLRDMDLSPGDLREQITIDLPGLMDLLAGTRLRVGPAVLEITKPCEPCTHIGEHVGVDAVEEFRDHLRGRRGMLARFLQVDGEAVIRVGDPVEILAEEPAQT